MKRLTGRMSGRAELATGKREGVFIGVVFTVELDPQSAELVNVDGVELIKDFQDQDMEGPVTLIFDREGHLSKMTREHVVVQTRAEQRREERKMEMARATAEREAMRKK